MKWTNNAQIHKKTHMKQNPDIHFHGQTSLLQLFNVPILAGNSIYPENSSVPPQGSTILCSLPQVSSAPTKPQDV